MSKEELQRIKGGASGLAAAIQRQKAQAGGLQELRKSPRENRAAKSQSVYVMSEQAPKPGRVHSITDGMLSSRSNGSIPGGSPGLQRPMSMVATTADSQNPPPKPPRTRSTSPSTFLSLERGVSPPNDKWDVVEEQEDDYSEDEEIAIEIEGCEGAEVNGRDGDESYCREDGAATPEQREEEDVDGGKLEETVKEEQLSAAVMEEEEEETSPLQVKKPHPPTWTKRSMSHTSDVGPDSSPSTSSSTSYGTPSGSPAIGRRESDGKGGYPKVPLLPPGANTSPLLNKTTPTSGTPSSTPKKSPMLPKTSPSPVKVSTPKSKSSPGTPRIPPATSASGKAFSKSCSSEGSPETGDKEETNSSLELQRENERLRQELMMLKSKMMSGNVSGDLDSVVEIDNPLTTECDDDESVFSRPRSRSVSPCEDSQELGGADMRPAKPVPQPRTRAQTMTASVSGDRKPFPVPYSPSSPALGMTTSSRAVAVSSSSSKPSISNLVSGSAPKSSGSPVPKPRSNATTSSSNVSSISSEVAKAEDKQKAVRGTSSRKSSEQGESEGGSTDERSDSAGSNYSSSSAEKIKASLMLQKLLPRIPKPQVGSMTVTQQSADNSQHSGTKILTSSAAQSASASSSSSSPKPIPVPRSVHLSSSSSQPQSPSSLTSSFQEHPATPISTTASATTMGSTSQTRSQAQATPTTTAYSSSVPPPSLLPQTSYTPGVRSPSPSSVKAPLNPTATQARKYSAGKAKYKKVTLDDTSWIKRKESLSSERSLSSEDSKPKESDPSKSSSASSQITLSSTSSKPSGGSSSQPLGTKTNKPASGSSTSSIAAQPPSQPLPYRSHPILPTPKPVPQPFLTPSPNLPKKSDVPAKPLPPRPGEPPKKKDSPPPPNAKGKKWWGRNREDGSKEGKKDKKKPISKSNSDEDLAPPSGEGVYVCEFVE